MPFRDRNRRVLVACIAVVVAMMLSPRVDFAADPPPVAPRLRQAPIRMQMPEMALGGGEVALELTVSASGTVTRVDHLVVTPPYADLMSDTVSAWRFDPAMATKDGRTQPIAARVLVIGLFRPPSLYSGPSAGVQPKTVAAPSAALPSLQSQVLPPYPANATGNGIVLVEIEMTNRAVTRNWRVVGGSLGFESAALDAVRAWQFAAPRAADVPDKLYVYAVVGFRTPLAPVVRNQAKPSQLKSETSDARSRSHIAMPDRSDLNPARTSWQKSAGCSHAAKCPPFSTRL